MYKGKTVHRDIKPQSKENLKEFEASTLTYSKMHFVYPFLNIG